jgi:signal transduction histidine kinase
MQTGDLLIALGFALALSLFYNLYQAQKRRQLHAAFLKQQEEAEQLERFRQELRSVRSELLNERQVTDTLKQQVADAGRTRSTFLDHMSYFVRSPLNIIIGYSDMLLSGVYGDMPEAQRTRVATVQRNGNDLLKYFMDMLELHRLELGGIELKLRPIAVESLFEQVINSAPQSSAELKTEIEPHTGKIMGDEQRVLQVISHLVSNAVRFTRKGSVTLGARQVIVKNGAAENFQFPTIGWLRDGEWIILTVNDTGIGIPSEAQASIFETFYQVSREQTDEQRGIGLGLAIAKRLIELHRGVIWVKSAEGKGSTFFIALNAYRDIRATDTQERLLMTDTKPKRG